MSNKKQKNALAIASPKDALALVERTIDKVVIRVGNAEKRIKERTASFHEGIAFGLSGRILSQKKYDEAYGKQMPASLLSSSYEAIQEKMDVLGVEALKRQASAVGAGRRKVVRVFANLSNGRSVVETITTNKIVDIEAVLEETKVNGKPVITAEVASALARNLQHYKLA